jgi:hypothetical protein
MAKALQCPACGSRHPLSDLPNAPTFRCSGCGRALKVPAQVRPASARTGAPAPRARQSDRTATLPAGAAAAAGGVAAPPAPPPRPPTPSRRDHRPPPGPVAPRVAWPFRLIAWVIAVPVGLVAVVFPARRLGFLSGQRLLDVLVGTGWSRYWRVLVIAPAWAFVTAVLVQLMLMGMRKLADRRRAVVGARRPFDDAEPGGNSRGSRRDGRGSGSRGRRGRDRR